MFRYQLLLTFGDYCFVFFSVHIRGSLFGIINAYLYASSCVHFDITVGTGQAQLW